MNRDEEVLRAALAKIERWANASCRAEKPTRNEMVNIAQEARGALTLPTDAAVLCGKIPPDGCGGPCTRRQHDSGPCAHVIDPHVEITALRREIDEVTEERDIVLADMNRIVPDLEEKLNHTRVLLDDILQCVRTKTDVLISEPYKFAAAIVAARKATQSLPPPIRK